MQIVSIIKDELDNYLIREFSEMELSRADRLIIREFPRIGAVSGGSPGI